MNPASPNPASVVILTRTHSAYGGMVLDSALRSGLSIRGVVLQRWGFREKFRRLLALMRQFGVLGVLVARSIEMLDGFVLNRGGWRRSAERVATEHQVPTWIVGLLNSEETLLSLQALSPDLILLAGVGIIGAPIIRCAKLGVLNGHSGTVPRYRGNYVVRWALLEEAPVGLTVHLVDEGVDTGDVLLAEPLEVPPTRSLRRVESLADEGRARLLVEGAVRYLSGQAKPVPQNDPPSGPSYGFMPLGKLLRTYRNLWRRGRNPR